jgi:hypothetical protein
MTQEYPMSIDRLDPGPQFSRYLVEIAERD